jgi:hypothetical protein
MAKILPGAFSFSTQLATWRASSSMDKPTASICGGNCNSVSPFMSGCASATVGLLTRPLCATAVTAVRERADQDVELGRGLVIGALHVGAESPVSTMASWMFSFWRE